MSYWVLATPKDHSTLGRNNKEGMVMYSQPLPLTWCDGCECYASSPDHSCADKLAQRQALADDAPARVDKRLEHRREYLAEYRAYCALKRAERRAVA